MTVPYGTAAAAHGGLLVRSATAADVPALHAVERAAALADGSRRWSSLGDLQHALNWPLDVPAAGSLIVAQDGQRVAGFSRCGHFRQADGLHVFTHRSG